MLKRRRFCLYRDKTTSFYFAEAIKMADIALRPDLENEEGGRRRREKKKSKEISVFEPGASCESGDDESTTNQ